MPSCLGSVSTMNFKPVGIQKSKNQRSASEKRYEAVNERVSLTYSPL